MTAVVEANGLITRKNDAATCESDIGTRAATSQHFAARDSCFSALIDRWDSGGTIFGPSSHHSHMEMANGICAMLNEQSGSYFGYLGGRSQKSDFFFFFFSVLSRVCGRGT